MFYEFRYLRVLPLSYGTTRVYARNYETARRYLRNRVGRAFVLSFGTSYA